MEHTPAPWAVKVIGGDDIEMTLRVITGPRCPGGNEICIVTTGSYSDEVEAANAQLIAATPDLLKALEDAIRCLDIDGPASCAASIATNGRAAIAKAKS